MFVLLISFLRNFLLLLLLLFVRDGPHIILQVHSCFEVVLGLGEHNISQAAEYRLRRALLTQYDRMVRPVLQPSDVINVTFLLDFKALSEVVSWRYVYIKDGHIVSMSEFLAAYKSFE